jgi:hypothetical protein
LRHFKHTIRLAVVDWSKRKYPDCTSEWDKQQQALKNLKPVAVLLHKKPQENKVINE